MITLDYLGESSALTFHISYIENACFKFEGGYPFVQNFPTSIIQDNAWFYMFSVLRLFLLCFVLFFFFVEFVLGLIVRPMMNID